jgi:hypothetical protein
METWPEKSCVCASDSVIADKVCKVNADMERSNREATAGQFKHVWTCKEAGSRWGPAAASCRQARPRAPCARIVPNGFLLPTCPVPLTPTRSCLTRRRSAHGRTRRSNVTKRGSGSTLA